MQFFFSNQFYADLYLRYLLILMCYLLLLYIITSEGNETVLISTKLNLDLDEFNLDLFRWMRTEGASPTFHWLYILFPFCVTLRKNRISMAS